MNENVNITTIGETSIVESGLVTYIYGNSVDSIKVALGQLVNIGYYKQNGIDVVLGIKADPKEYAAVLSAARTETLSRVSPGMSEVPGVVVIPTMDKLFCGENAGALAISTKISFLTYLAWCEQNLTPSSNIKLYLGINLKNIIPSEEERLANIPMSVFTSIKPGCSIPLCFNQLVIEQRKAYEVREYMRQQEAIEAVARFKAMRGK